jgi:hypothetical protein
METLPAEAYGYVVERHMAASHFMLAFFRFDASHRDGYHRHRCALTETCHAQGAQWNRSR